VFEDGKRHRVAIKRFKIPLNDRIAHRYQTVINELREAGVRLPKMAMLKTASGEWVQVSQLFGSTGKGAKIGDGGGLNTKAKLDLAKQLTKIANLGYDMNQDIFASFRDPSKRCVVIDIDALAASPKFPPYVQAMALFGYAFMLFPKGNEAEEIFRVMLNQASPEIKSELKKILQRLPKK